MNRVNRFRIILNRTNRRCAILRKFSMTISCWKWCFAYIGVADNAHFHFYGARHINIRLITDELWFHFANWMRCTEDQKEKRGLFYSGLFLLGLWGWWYTWQILFSSLHLLFVHHSKICSKRRFSAFFMCLPCRGPDPQRSRDNTETYQRRGGQGRGKTLPSPTQQL